MLQARPVATVQDFAAATGGSEATIRRDLTALASQGRLRKLRDGAEALQPPTLVAFNARHATGSADNAAGSPLGML